MGCMDSMGAAFFHAVKRALQHCHGLGGDVVDMLKGRMMDRAKWGRSAVFRW